MTGLVRKATLLSACGLLLAGVSMAGIPNAANSQKPCVILMDYPNSPNNVGVNPGVCSVPALKVIVRDALNNPVNNSDVVLDFSACGAVPGPVMLGDTQSDPAVTTACTGRTVLKTSNALGEVCFSVYGNNNTVVNSSGIGGYPLPNRNVGGTAGVVCCKLYASGNLLGTQLVIVNHYDLDANVLVTAGDRAYVLDAEGQAYRTYPDYDCNGAVNAGDRSLMLDAEGQAGELVYTGTYCP